MKPAVLFLTGRYRADDLDFYRRLCRGRFKVAVDGGLSFFGKSGLTPDLLIGDMDSIARSHKQILKNNRVISFPPGKDATDAELAIDYCLDHGCNRIDIVQPVVGEPDHFMGNVMLLTRNLGESAEVTPPFIRLVNKRYEIRYVRDDSIQLNGCSGDMISVIPVSARVRLSCSGLEYEAERLVLVRGQTHGLRNRISKSRAEISVEGEAVVVQTVKPGRAVKINP